MGNRDRFTAPVNTFKTLDGYVCISVATDAHFAKAAAIVGADVAMRDERFRLTSDRVAHAEEAEALISSFVAPRSCAEEVARFESEGIPAAKVATIEDVAANPQLRHRRFMQDVDHPRAGKVPLPATPFRLGATPGAIRAAPPTIGQHNDEIYGALLGYTEERVRNMRSSKLI